MLLRYMRIRDPRGLALRQTDDGLLDIGIGAGLLFAGVMSFLGLEFTVGAFAVVWLPLALVAKIGITLPRVPVARATPLPGTRYVPASFVLPVLLPIVMTLLPHEVTARPSLVGLLARLPAGDALPAVLPALLGAGALYLGLREAGRSRPGTYAGLTLVLWLGGLALGLDTGWRFLVIGGIVAAYGTTILRRFLRSCPPVPAAPRMA